MTKYKSLFEKRLKQLNPIEELPITEERLTKESSIKISPKRNIKDSYELLYEKYISLLKDYNYQIDSSLKNKVDLPKSNSEKKYKLYISIRVKNSSSSTEIKWIDKI